MSSTINPIFRRKSAFGHKGEFLELYAMFSPVEFLNYQSKIKTQEDKFRRRNIKIVYP
jgi:hypothetical protein